MFSMLTLLYALNTYLTLINTNIYIYIYIYIYDNQITFYFFQFNYFFRLVICHLSYRFSIPKVLHSGIVPKSKLWYRAIPNAYASELSSAL